ncbi:MAG: glycerophosphodiester phosphodiesterase family protein [Balneolales bacterium]
MKKNQYSILAFIVLFLMLGYFMMASLNKSNDLHVFDIDSPSELKNFFKYQEGQGPLISSHRGGMREGFPENVLETFENTIRHTWSLMEVDPRYSKDSSIVLFHDNTLNRTSTGTGRVSDYTLEELKNFNLTDPLGNVTDFTMPTLDEALKWAKGKTILFLDSKDVPVEARVRKIQEHNAQSYAVIMAYSLEDAKRCYEMDPDIMMQIFMSDKAAVARFEETGIPWENVIGFVTHMQPKESDIFQVINNNGAMAVMGSSRTIDRAFTNGEIDEYEMKNRYEALVKTGANIIEADLSLEASKALENLRNQATAKQHYFIYD